VSFDLDPADPVAAAADLRAGVADATRRLLETAQRVTDAQAREPSLLPGWSRGHVLTHIARNADGLRNLLIWARTGVVTPQYAESGERERQIAAGAGRSAAELLADVDGSATALAAEADSLRPGDWSAEVRGRRGPAHAAWFTLWRRLSEVEIHHIDLGAGYTAADWPTPFTTTALTRAAADFSDAESPPALLRSQDPDLVLQIGPPGSAPSVAISGPARVQLAWLIGRSDGAGLTVTPAGPLPALPPW
jgi:maleylpyruvate isomerase